MSLRVNLSLLVDHINTFYNRPDPNLKFNLLFNDSVPESFFSHEMSLTEVVGSDASSLRFRVDSAFKDHLRTFAPLFASLLQCKVVKLPKDVLHVLIPFVYGDDVWKDVFGKVGDIMSRNTARGGKKRKKNAA